MLAHLTDYQIQQIPGLVLLGTVAWTVILYPRSHVSGTQECVYNKA